MQNHKYYYFFFNEQKHPSSLIINQLNISSGERISLDLYEYKKISAI